ncbi:hypothetical protein MHH70_12895 [Metasolibacillus sp. FSL H7-0170]|uniref:hypothetical protein n=1 Tax=Metasolibacillus TaxID=2703677 RepID=UPI001F25FF49|nr:hypothetical protein [Metasolibacillus fluoroglycofenilyticus]
MDATHQVQEVISSIVSETTKTVETVEGTMKTARKLNDDVVLTQSKFNEMSDSVNQIAASIEVVNKEMDAMTSYNKLMSEGIESASEQTAASVQEIAASTDEQIKVIADV